MLNAERCRYLHFEYFIWQSSNQLHLPFNGSRQIDQRRLVLINSIKFKRIFAFNDLSNSPKAGELHSIDFFELLNVERWALNTELCLYSQSNLGDFLIIVWIIKYLLLLLWWKMKLSLWLFFAIVFFFFGFSLPFQGNFNLWCVWFMLTFKIQSTKDNKTWESKINLTNCQLSNAHSNSIYVQMSYVIRLMRIDFSNIFISSELDHSLIFSSLWGFAFNFPQTQTKRTLFHNFVMISKWCLTRAR